MISRNGVHCTLARRSVLDDSGLPLYCFFFALIMNTLHGFDRVVWYCVALHPPLTPSSPTYLITTSQKFKQTPYTRTHSGKYRYGETSLVFINCYTNRCRRGGTGGGGCHQKKKRDPAFG
ncbi:hypothetical protein BDW02DRAFT_303434 [Decorospora gaudefroyi]|uniref:Uncharacterized protein n=1 Tax=Decorospora gaudefroyi TaxID=184978 RepID=A0A6A5KTW4_9PLEO|nr:hypothetical protein BDW02DRAFT_303434 [Decorospora gaudefroyi]